MTPPPSTASTVERDAVAATETLRPLSVAELQLALRNARTPPSLRCADDWGGGFESTEDPDQDAEYVDDEPTETHRDQADVKARRFGRRKAGADAKRPRRVRVTPGARRLLGLDRCPKKERVDHDWLAEFDQPTLEPADPTSPRPVADTVLDVGVSDAPRGLVAVFWR